MSKRKFKFNIVDFILIIAFIAAAVLVWLVFSPKGIYKEDNLKTVKVEYVVEVRSIREDFLKKVDTVSTAYDLDTGKEIGIVTNFDSSPTYHIGKNIITASQVLSEVENRKDLHITIEAEAQIKENRYAINDIFIDIGSTVNLMFPELYCSGTCISYTIIE